MKNIFDTRRDLPSIKENPLMNHLDKINLVLPPLISTSKNNSPIRGQTERLVEYENYKKSTMKIKKTNIVNSENVSQEDLQRKQKNEDFRKSLNYIYNQKRASRQNQGTETCEQSDTDTEKIELETKDNRYTIFSVWSSIAPNNTVTPTRKNQFNNHN